MAFLNPLLLFGTAAISAPILIHLLMNRKLKRVVWAAMRFLQLSVEKNQKRMNVEDLILLLLRCLLLILLALALARPVFRGAGAAMVGKSPETAIIAIDNSYSMGQSDGAQSRFDQAKEAAEQVIDSLEPGSSVAVFFFSDVVKAAIPEPTFDMNLARKIVRDATLSDRGTDVDIVLKQAMDTMSHHTAALERIYLVTDGQAAGWKQMSDISTMLHNQTARTSVILVGGPEWHNMGVSDLRFAGSIASVGEASQFDVEVTNFGVGEVKNVAVRLSIDGETASDEGVINSISAGGKKHIVLFTKFGAVGYHTVTAEINADHLHADDQRTIAVRVMDDVRVLLVTADSSIDPGENALFYLRNALTPVPPSERDKYLVKTKTITPSELDSTKLSDYEAVVLANVPSISTGALDAISSYLTRGGGLIIFPGERMDPAFYNDNFGKKLGMLPATIGAARGKADATTFFTLQGKTYTHRIVSIWNDPGSGTLATAHFYRAYELKPDTGRTAQAGEPQTVVKYLDGAPAVMERTWGRGRVILFSSSANTAWNDMPLHPAYLPFMERTLGSILDQQDAQINVRVGAPFEFVCDPDWVNKDAIITLSGAKAETGTLRHINTVDGVPLLQFADTDKAGAYDVTIKADPPVPVKFAVQADPAESDLTDLTPSQLDAVAPAGQVIHWTPTTRLNDQIAKDRGGSEFWTTLAFLVLIAACAEMTLGGIFSASK